MAQTARATPLTVEMITLASDFGTPYPAAMKGAILQTSDARLVDVSHEFPRQDVRTAAFWLREILPEFPPAVHLVVVDPGVGTDRDALIIRAGDHALVGPDNGVLLPPARELADTDELEVYDLTIGDPRSTTFHGRDVFAPGAAAVHEAGVDRVGTLEGVSPHESPVDLRFPDPELFEGGVRGEVLVVDGFGNAVTNIPGDVLDGRGRIRIDGTDTPVVRSYAAVEPGTAVVTVGSHGNVELAVNRGRGDEAFGVAPGDTVEMGD